MSSSHLKLLLLAVGASALLVFALPADESHGKGTGGRPAFADDCLRCHEPIKTSLSQAVPHGPAADGDCIACHAVHAAKYDHMLNQRERALCNTCHEESVLSFQTGSIHTPVREGQCSACHDPHAAPNAALLKLAGNDLCWSCHEEKKKQTELAHVHSPFVDEDCSVCHLPHNSPHLDQLTEPKPQVCTQCHEDEGEEILLAHRRIPVKGKDCTRCHDPHASDVPKVLRSVVHQPFAQGECSECHRVQSSAPLSLVATGARLCQNCHEGYPRPNDKAIHDPIAQGNCGACHASHASDGEKLLLGDSRALCVSCHQDIDQRFKKSLYAHPQTVEKGSCTICHQPHSSKDEGLLNSDGIRTCLPCHQDQRHGHPMGTDRVDPRTNQPMTCLSCHDVHGTAFPYNLVGDRNRGLCVECHSGEKKKDRQRRRQ